MSKANTSPIVSNTSSAPIQSTKRRNGGIEYARFLGAVGIIWFHMKMPGGWISYAALPMFIILLIYFGWGRNLGNRAERLLVPWALWSLVFVALHLAEVFLTPSTFVDEFKFWMLFTGPSIHLWFLPFSFAFLALAKAMGDKALYIALPASLGAIWLMNATTLPIPLAQWTFVLPAAFTGLLMRQTNNPTLLAGVTIFLAGAMNLAGYYAITPQLIIATGLVWALMTLPIKVTRLSTMLSDLSLGIYLSHPVFVAIGDRTPLADHQFLHFIFVLAGSVISTIVLRRIIPPMVGFKAAAR